MTRRERLSVGSGMLSFRISNSTRFEVSPGAKVTLPGVGRPPTRSPALKVESLGRTKSKFTVTSGSVSSLRVIVQISLAPAASVTDDPLTLIRTGPSSSNIWAVAAKACSFRVTFGSSTVPPVNRISTVSVVSSISSSTGVMRNSFEVSNGRNVTVPIRGSPPCTSADWAGSLKNESVPLWIR